jgi:hypothetical protein
MVRLADHLGCSSFTQDGLISATSIVMLDAALRKTSLPALARRLFGLARCHGDPCGTRRPRPAWGAVAAWQSCWLAPTRS